MAVVVFYGCFMVSPGLGAEESPSGPLYQSNRFPTLLMVMTPVPHSPDPAPGRFHFNLQTDYTSVYINKQSGDYQVLTDMEIGVVTPRFSARAGKNLTFSVSVPFISYNGGFLDEILEDYHDAGHFPDYGRSSRPDNEFACVVEKNGKTWFSPEQGGFHPGDSRVDLEYSLIRHPAFAGSLMYSLKLPTGDADRGFGSGGVDQGLFALTRMTAGNFSLYLSPGVIFPQDPETRGADISYDTMYTLFTGIEYTRSRAWSFMVQLNTMTSPLENTGIDTLDDPGVELALGFTRRWDNVKASFSFCEDLSGTAPDFTVHAGIEIDFDISGKDGEKS